MLWLCPGNFNHFWDFSQAFEVWTQLNSGFYLPLSFCLNLSFKSWRLHRLHRGMGVNQFFSGLCWDVQQLYGVCRWKPLSRWHVLKQCRPHLLLRARTQAPFHLAPLPHIWVTPTSMHSLSLSLLTVVLSSGTLGRGNFSQVVLWGYGKITGAASDCPAVPCGHLCFPPSWHGGMCEKL